METRNHATASTSGLRGHLNSYFRNKSIFKRKYQDLAIRRMTDKIVVHIIIDVECTKVLVPAAEIRNKRS